MTTKTNPGPRAALQEIENRRKANYRAYEEFLLRFAETGELGDVDAEVLTEIGVDVQRFDSDIAFVELVRDSDREAAEVQQASTAWEQERPKLVEQRNTVEASVKQLEKELEAARRLQGELTGRLSATPKALHERQSNNQRATQEAVRSGLGDKPLLARRPQESAASWGVRALCHERFWHKG